MMLCGKRTSKEKAMKEIRENGNRLINDLLYLMNRDDLDKDQMVNLMGTINMANKDLLYKFKKGGAL